MQYRTDFNHATMDTLDIGADASTMCDTSADSASLLALQTPQPTALTSLLPTRGRDASALRLFGL